MKKRILLIGLIIILIFIFAGCNYDVIDTTYSYDRAIIALPNGEVIEGKVDKWKDYDGEQVQITIDGKTYLTQISYIGGRLNGRPLLFLKGEKRP